MPVLYTFFIGFTVFLMGAVCLNASAEIAHTLLGKKIALGFGLFWLARLLVQFFVFSPELWKGKRFETIAHLIFSLLWIYFSAVFLTVALRPL